MTRALYQTGFGALVLAAFVAGCAPVPPVSNPLATPQPAPVTLPPQAAPKDRLVAAIEQSGCLLTADNRAAIQLRANLSLEQLQSLTQELRDEGRVEVPPGASGTIRLLSQNCI